MRTKQHLLKRIKDLEEETERQQGIIRLEREKYAKLCAQNARTYLESALKDARIYANIEDKRSKVVTHFQPSWGEVKSHNPLRGYQSTAQPDGIEIAMLSNDGYVLTLALKF
jgi:hypothetical protein